MKTTPFSGPGISLSNGPQILVWVDPELVDLLVWGLTRGVGSDENSFLQFRVEPRGKREARRKDVALHLPRHDLFGTALTPDFHHPNLAVRTCQSQLVVSGTWG